MEVLKVALVVAFLACTGPGRGGSATGPLPQDMPEYPLKAAFLYNFAKYTQWPDDAFEQPDSPIVVAVAGADPFGPELEKVLQGKTVGSRPFKIERFKELPEIRRCHILFVPKSEQSRQAQIQERIRTWPVLTVGEDPAFARSGGVLSILVVEREPRLEVNAVAAERHRLTIHAKLLRLATPVKEEGK